MKQQFVADGEERVLASEELQARVRVLRATIRAKYAAELATAGFFRRWVLRWLISREFWLARRKLLPSSQTLYTAEQAVKATMRHSRPARRE